MDSNKEFYDKMRNTLNETTVFPGKYLFKFILPSIQDRIKEVEELFNHMGAVIETKPSKNGNYTALSILVRMESADQVIEKYQKAATIKGIVLL